MSALLLRVQGVGKDFPLTAQAGERLRALGSLLRGRRPAQLTTVLDAVDFEVRRGESLAIIGDNGAGKSTLLKLVTGVLTPSRGVIERHGRIGALLELGAGFHPEYSGRDNVRLAAAMHGLSGEALQAALPEIEAFADIGHYLDEPVKHYSTGMAMRLGFAVIAATRPDLLITDEVLAVGDERFQRKCIRWLDSYLETGGTLLLVSHSTYHVQRLCQRALWLQAGRMQGIGPASEICQRYTAAQESREAEDTRAAIQGQALRVNASVVNGMACGEGGEVSVAHGASLSLEVTLVGDASDAPVLSVGVLRADGTPVHGIDSRMAETLPTPTVDGWRFQLRFEPLLLLPGRYEVRLFPMDSEALRMYAPRTLVLTVTGDQRDYGLVRLPHRWGIRQ